MDKIALKIFTSNSRKLTWYKFHNNRFANPQGAKNLEILNQELGK